MNPIAELPVDIDRSELLKLAAGDSVFYCRHFFPKTFRQRSPEYHRDFWTHFEDSDYDFFGAEIFRGGGKTTLTRAGISKRIAFAISRNILCVAISEAMAIHTIRWLKRAVETNLYWATTFQLRKGQKWTDDWIEIYNEPFDSVINVIAKGMTSGLRGLNPDDWRPDFIFCDDISNEETTGTEEQLQKNYDLFNGALVPSLAPKSEAPLRKLVLAQTGLHKQDIIYRAHDDPAWSTVKYPKLVEMEDGSVKSAWEERFPTEECIAEKQNYVKKGQTHIWLREFGCKIVSRETAPLPDHWLRYWKVLPMDLVYFLGIDPATDSKNKSAHRTAMSLIGVQPVTGNTFLVEYKAQQGKNPDELWVWFVEMMLKYHPRLAGVETIAYQKMLAWYFRKKMTEENRYWVIQEVADKRSKPTRIIDAFGMASHGKFYVNENHTDFIAAWVDWNETIDWDLGDATAQAITLANPWMIQFSGDDLTAEYQKIEEEQYPDIVFEGGCP